MSNFILHEDKEICTRRMTCDPDDGKRSLYIRIVVC